VEPERRTSFPFSWRLENERRGFRAQSRVIVTHALILIRPPGIRFPWLGPESGRCPPASVSRVKPTGRMQGSSHLFTNGPQDIGHPADPVGSFLHPAHTKQKAVRILDCVFRRQFHLRRRADSYRAATGTPPRPARPIPFPARHSRTSALERFGIWRSLVSVRTY